MPRFVVPRAAAAALLIGAASVAAECAPVDVMLEERLGQRSTFELPTGYVVIPSEHSITVATCGRSHGPATAEVVERESITTVVTVRCDRTEDETKIEAFDIDGGDIDGSHLDMQAAVAWNPQPKHVVLQAGWPLNLDHGIDREVPTVFRDYQLARCIGLYPGVVGDAFLHRSGVADARVTIRKSPAPTTFKYGVDNQVDPATVASDDMVEAYFAGLALKKRWH